MKRCGKKTDNKEDLCKTKPAGAAQFVDMSQETQHVILITFNISSLVLSELRSTSELGGAKHACPTRKHTKTDRQYVTPLTFIRTNNPQTPLLLPLCKA